MRGVVFPNIKVLEFYGHNTLDMNDLFKLTRIVFGGRIINKNQEERFIQTVWGNPNTGAG